MTAASCTPRGISRIREKITLLPLYHSGVLSKKYPAEQYTKRLELRDLKAMQKVGSEFGWSVYSAQRGVSSEGQASGPDAEEWRGYILAVTKMEIPKKMSLLLGQMMRLEVVIKEECKRTSLSLKEDALGAPCRTNSNITADLPSCLCNVTQQEAAQMLQADPEWGDIILRPSTDSDGYAITMRRIISG